MSKKTILLYFSQLLFLLLIISIYHMAVKSPRIAYVDSGKLIVGFSEANAVDREVKAEDDKWQLQLKILQDSLQATINNMSKEYDPVTQKG